MKQPVHLKIRTKIVFENLYHVIKKNYYTSSYPWLICIVADSARVVIPKLDGNSDYINFCYINVSIRLSSYLRNYL